MKEQLKIVPIYNSTKESKVYKILVYDCYGIPHSHTEIARVMDVNIQDYVNTLIKDYNAKTSMVYCGFDKEEDAQRALDEYILPRFIMRKLSNDV
jgi:hypothetical protein